MVDKYSYAKNLIRSILLEEVNVNDIADAIRKKHVVTITYSDGANGKREIMPVVYGLSTKGNTIIRAYQVNGDSNTKDQGWKIFLTNKIGLWDDSKGTTFSKPPLKWTDGAYNENSDEKFSQIYISADFGSEEENIAYGSKPEVEDYNREEPTVRTVNQKPTTNSKISGIDIDTNADTKAQEINDMSKTKDFGDKNQSSTVGPVYKDEKEDTDGIEDNVNYSQIQNVGPKYKGNDIEPKEEEPFGNVNFSDDEEEYNKEENNL